MADKKISALTAATTPLAGSEVLPIVQGGATVKVSVDNLTTGKPVSMSNLTYTGTLTGSTSVVNIGSGQIYKAADGKVGVGAADPISMLDIKNNAGTGNHDILRLRRSSVTSGNRSSILWTSDDFNPDLEYARIDAIVTSGTSGDLVFSPAVGSTPTEQFRVASTGNATLATGNLVIGTSGKGIDFSADPSAAGMTSELLDDYEEGTWTPTDASGAGLTLTVTAATYTKIGRMVYASLNITFPTTANGSTLILGGLPFTSSQLGSLAIGYTTQGASIMGLVGAGDTLFFLYDAAGNNLANSQMSAKVLRAVAIYPA
jgi:hypothetical protein